MKKMMAIVIMVGLIPSLCFAGALWTSYDDSHIDKFKQVAQPFLETNLEEKPIILDKLYSIHNALGNHCAEVTVIFDKKKCSLDYKYTSDSLSVYHMAYAKQLVKTEKNEDAKKVLRNFITTFTGKAYSGDVKEAEFMLEDLNTISQPTTNNDSDVEKLKLQLELEKTKLELEKLKAQNNKNNATKVDDSRK